LRRIRTRMKRREEQVVGEFSCRGRFWIFGRNRPNHEDEKRAEEFGRAVASR